MRVSRPVMVDGPEKNRSTLAAALLMGGSWRCMALIRRLEPCSMASAPQSPKESSLPRVETSQVRPFLDLAVLLTVGHQHG